MNETNRDETVAGIPEEVYNLTFRNDRGASQAEESILGRVATLRELTKVLATWSRMMAVYLSVELSECQSTMDDLLQVGDGILRQGSGYRLRRSRCRAGCPKEMGQGR
jgi:hypothetical protein